MSEKIPQSDPEMNAEKRYFIPVSGDHAVIGSVNFRRQRIDASRRIEGPDMMITLVEVSYESKDDEGNTVIVAKWVSDHHFTEVGQRDLQEKYFKAMEKNDREQYE
jgi:hypothetical protein